MVLLQEPEVAVPPCWGGRKEAKAGIPVAEVGRQTPSSSHSAGCEEKERDLSFHTEKHVELPFFPL